MIYKFQTHFKTAGLDPQVIGETLEKVRISHDGKLTSEDVVLEARNETSPLHSWFTWDDSEAAHQWRMAEAQRLVRCVLVVTEPTASPQKAFYSIIMPDEDGGSERFYQSHAVIAKDPNQYASALRIIIGDLAGAEASLERLQRLAPSSNRIAVRRATDCVTEAHKTLMAQTP